MIRFLLQRSIAVIMAFIAMFILGLTAYYILPVSLLPDIAIPEITIQISAKNRSARELENTTVRPIRQQLLQVSNIRDIESRTRDGNSIIKIKFEYGINTDLAFIEVNEKVDGAMGLIPKGISRPKVIKASATDIPVFCINMTLNDIDSENEENINDYLELSDLANNVIKRRIEQLEEVAMVDITGCLSRKLNIIPNVEKINYAGITIEDIENALISSNVEPGSMTIREGHQQYNIMISSFLRTEEDVKNIFIKKNERIYQLKDLANISIVPQEEAGISLSQNKRAVTLAIIKQTDDNLGNMKEALNGVTEYFRDLYPNIDFTISRNQTELLDYTISNLKQNLLIGFILIFLVSLVFLGDFKSPFVIALCMIISISVSFIFFYLFNVSLNIISLSGLILALGMMIDSGIIVTENISQYQSQGYSLKDSCDKGTSEVITPMLSSTFTTIAVFIPLVFISGIAGAIFYDQAFAVTIGLLTSYITGIIFLPVIYNLIYKNQVSIDDNKSVNIIDGLKKEKRSHILISIDNYHKRITQSVTIILNKAYNKILRLTFNYKSVTIILVLLAMPLCGLLFYIIPKSGMPEIEQSELIVKIDWNDNIHVEENKNRIISLCNLLSDEKTYHTAYIGEQQFLLNRDSELSISEAELYFKAKNIVHINEIEALIKNWFYSNYPDAIFSFYPPETIFEKIFVTGEADIIAGVTPYNKSIAPSVDEICELSDKICDLTGENNSAIAIENQINFLIDREKMLLYNIDYNDIVRTLKTTLRNNEVTTLRSYQQYIPIAVSDKDKSISDALENSFIKIEKNIKQDKEEKGLYPIYDESLPLSSFITTYGSEDIKTIYAGRNGEYIPFKFYNPKDPKMLMSKISEIKKDKWDVQFMGSYFENNKMLKELIFVLIISIVLMYFILAAQFESFSQPFIVLIEIPIDIAAALLVLYITGNSLNLMSAIGIIVTCGIIINDSILKIDMINELRKKNIPLMDAIHEAGNRRLRPIIMTSLTTIFAMLPILFTFDMGSELQQPLAIGMIAAMVIGTMVSLFIVPVIYFHLTKD